MFDAAGLAESHLGWLQGNFFGGGAGPTEGDVCAGAQGPLEHSHFFTDDGAFGSHDEHGEQVDDGDYELVDEDTLAFPSHASEFGYDGDLIVDYEITGDVVTFDVVLPDACEDTCKDAYAWALSASPPGHGPAAKSPADSGPAHPTPPPPSRPRRPLRARRRRRTGAAVHRPRQPDEPLDQTDRSATERWPTRSSSTWNADRWKPLRSVGQSQRAMRRTSPDFADQAAVVERIDPHAIGQRIPRAAEIARDLDGAGTAIVARTPRSTRSATASSGRGTSRTEHRCICSTCGRSPGWSAPSSSISSSNTSRNVCGTNPTWRPRQCSVRMPATPSRRVCVCSSGSTIAGCSRWSRWNCTTERPGTRSHRDHHAHRHLTGRGSDRRVDRSGLDRSPVLPRALQAEEVRDGSPTPTTLFLLAEDVGALVGLTAATITDRYAELDDLQVDPRWQRRGIASALLSGRSRESPSDPLAGSAADRGRRPCRHAEVYSRLGFEVVAVYGRYRKPISTVYRLGGAAAPGRKRDPLARTVTPTLVGGNWPKAVVRCVGSCSLAGPTGMTSSSDAGCRFRAGRGGGSTWR